MGLAKASTITAVKTDILSLEMKGVIARPLFHGLPLPQRFEGAPAINSKNWPSADPGGTGAQEVVKPASAQRVLITGATDGIGLALAKLYRAEKSELALVGRRRMESLADDLFNDATYCQADLAEPDAVDRILKFLARSGCETLDTVVLNAGLGWVGPIETQDPDAIRELVAVNLAAPITLAHALLPRLSGGQLVLIGSVAAAMPCPSYAVYAATKAALDGFARSLSIELRGRTRVQIVHPGATRTGMHEKAGANLPVHRFRPATEVARRIKRLIERRDGSQIVGRRNAAAWSIGRRLANVIDPAMRQARSFAGARSRTASRGLPKTALVTGAANGIGRALVQRLVELGYRTSSVDIDLPDADARRTPGMTHIRADLADPTAYATVLKGMRDRGPVSLLIHCAGTSSVGPFGKIGIADHRRTINVNLLTPMLLTAAMLRDQMIERGGAVVFVSSLSHFVSYPGASVYAGSKDGLTSYARSLYVAGATLDLKCLTVFPGPTRTEHARLYSPKGSSEARRMPPDQVAAAIVDAVARGRRSLVPGKLNQAYAVVGRHWPSMTERVMRRQVFEPLALENRLGK